MAEKKKAAAPAAAAATDKKKALETALAQIEKNYGKGAIMRLGDDIAVNVEAIPTGSLSLDLALGIGGVPRGRIIEIYGPESCGKTTLALHIVASAQKGGGADPQRTHAPVHQPKRHAQAKRIRQHIRGGRHCFVHVRIIAPRAGFSCRLSARKKRNGRRVSTIIPLNGLCAVDGISCR